MIRTALAAAALAALAPAAIAQDAPMGFFITSAGPGRGGDLGGLAGADAHCEALAAAVGAGGRGWRAYLSAPGEDARDRIGSGPWANAAGAVIADDVAELHDGAPRLDKAAALDETGAQVDGRGDSPNRHDILTGSTPEGRLAEGMTCMGWTSADEGRAMVGHHDRRGLRDDAPSRSWNSSHPSRGCSQDALRGTGGDGLFYCFATR